MNKYVFILSGDILAINTLDVLLPLADRLAAAEGYEPTGHWAPGYFWHHPTISQPNYPLALVPVSLYESTDATEQLEFTVENVEKWSQHESR